MNKVILIGRLARDSDVRNSNNNIMVLKNTVAVDRRNKQDGQSAADFIPIVAFGKTAEFMSNYFSKGKKVAITGRIQTGSYENAEGKKVYTTEVVVEEVEFVESKKSEGSDQMAQARQFVPESEIGGNGAAGQINSASDGYFPIDDDGEIPF